MGTMNTDDEALKGAVLCLKVYSIDISADPTGQPNGPQNPCFRTVGSDHGL
jgi:hypothetical protein